MATLYRNFLAGTITDSPLTDVATTVNSANFANLPVVSGSDIMWLVLDPDAEDGAPELVKVTAHTTSATSVTVEREQQSTVAREHLVGTVWRLVLTQTDVEEFLKVVPDDSIDSNHYVDGSIDLAHLAADSVNGSKIADDSIDSEHYVDGSIDTAHLADDAVTADKLASLAVRPSNFSPSVYTAATQGPLTLGVTWNVTYGTEVQDADGWGTAGTDTFTCPADGVYLVAAEVEFGPAATGTTNLNFTAPLSVWNGDQGKEVSSSENRKSLATMHYMRAGDTLKVAASISSGSVDSIIESTLVILRIY